MSFSPIAAMGHGSIQYRIMLVWLACLACSFLPCLAQNADGAKAATSESPKTHLGKGYDALKLDRYDEAVQEFRAALAADPSLVLRARFPLAVALFESHKADEARSEFETVRREVGDHPNVLYYLGRLDLDGLNFAGAIQNLSKAARKTSFS